jgi:hypothetical protein
LAVRLAIGSALSPPRRDSKLAASSSAHEAAMLAVRQEWEARSAAMRRDYDARLASECAAGPGVR